jgi:HK97 family phage major capsid protein
MIHKFTRSHAIDVRKSEDMDERDVDMAMSSEEPVERWFGVETLRHTPDAVDLSRLGDGRHPLLLGHDWSTQIGVVRAAGVDKDRVMRGRARFSQSTLGREILQDVRDEIRTLVSIGYEILEVEEEKTDEHGASVKRTLTGDQFVREMEQEHGEHFYRAGLAACRAKGSQPPSYVVTRWRPYEVSIVPIPADTAVGVGRAAGAAASAESSEVKPQPQPQPQRVKIMDTPEVKPPTDAERVSALLNLGEQYSKYVTQREVADAIRNGRTTEQFKDFVMSKIEAAHTDTRAVQIGMTHKEVQRYSIAKAVRASLLGKWDDAGLELEASRAVEKMLGRAPEGFYVPFDAFQRDFNVGTGSEAGNLVATDLRGDLYTDVLRNALVMARLGVRILPGLTSSIDIPRKTTAGTIGMVTEVQALSETSPLTAKVSLSPKRFGGFTEVSKQALIQSAMALEPLIRDDLLSGAAVVLEDQVINGSGSGANMRGIRNVSGIGSVAGGANGLAPAWSHIVDLESAVANVNAEPDRLSGYLVNTKTRGKLKQTTKATNLDFIWDRDPQFPLNGYRAAVTNNVPSNLTKGTSTTVCSALLFASDWSMQVIGLFGAPDVTVDPYTLATTGQVRITLNQFADTGNRQPGAFALMADSLSG